MKELKSDYTEKWKVVKEIFIIPKESVSDLNQIDLLLISLSAVWRGREGEKEVGGCFWSLGVISLAMRHCHRTQRPRHTYGRQEENPDTESTHT